MACNASAGRAPLAAAAVLASGALVAGCASGHQVAPPAAAAAPAGPARAAAVSAVDRLTRVAEQRYAREVHGSATHRQLRRVSHDAALLRALRTGRPAALRAAVAREQATRGAHISRLRVVKGHRVLADAGVVFVVAPSEQRILGAGGRYVGTIQLSIQDVIGFVRVMHRNWPVDVVVRGRGPAHVRTSLPAALRVSLPANGTARINGRRYQVRSFHRLALGREPITVWILHRG